MTITFWLATAQTVVFLCITGWAWWASTQIAHLLNAAELIRAHSEAGAQRATRAALDARVMLDVLTEHWQRMRDQQPETAPMERVGTDTVETGRVIDEGMDEFLTAARARWAEIAAAPVGKPAAKARRSAV